MDNNENKTLGIDITPEKASGSYSNLALIAHSHSEFIIDFASVLPGLPKAQVQSRVIMAPEHAKRLMFALQENISKYESHFGEIDLNGSNPRPRGTFNFNDFNKGGGDNRS